MRTSYLLFVVALLCITGLVYLTTRPDDLSPATERLIRQAISEAVAQELQRTPPPTTEKGVPLVESELRGVIQDLVREAVAAEMQAVREARTEEAVQNARRDAERRLSNQRQATTDAVLQDALRMASNIQAWKIKPPQFGGAAGQGFDELTLERIGFPETEPGVYTNMNGRYRVEGHPDHARVVGSNAQYGIQIIVDITGPGPDHITTDIQFTKAIR